MKSMKKTRSEDRELFLRYLIDIYNQNPELPLLYKIIYIELSRFYTCYEKQERLDLDSLVGVQVKLKNKFGNVSGINVFTSKDGYYLVIENRNNKSDNDYLNCIYNGIKLYIGVDAANIYKVTESLVNFAISNDIVIQSKISKEMRNDSLICRVTNHNDAIKICDYINSLGYNTKVKPNPFLFDNGNVGLIIDGTLSYNATLSRLLKEYIWVIKNNKTIDKIANDKEFDINSHFSNFVKGQIEVLKSTQKKDLMDLYNLDSEIKYKDFIMVSELIYKRLTDCLTIDELFMYYYGKDNYLINTEDVLFEYDDDKIKYIMSILSNYYSLDYVHKLIMEFINTGDYNLFSRDYGGIRNIIRNILENSISKEDFKNIISNLGWSALVSASKITYEKYGDEQLFCAIKTLFSDEDVKLFTNDFDVRSYLAFIIPQKLLKEVIVNKLEDNGMNISDISLASLMIEEISMIEEKNNSKDKIVKIV